MFCFNKQYFFKILILAQLALSLLVVGCVRGPNKNTNAKNKGGLTSFVTTEDGITSTSVKQVGTNSLWATPSMKEYNLRVCLISKRTRNPLPSRLSFQIVLKDNTIHKDETDVNGCLQWKERLAFNFFSDSKYITSERTIRATNSEHNGDLVKNLAINPWVEYRNITAEEVVDLDVSDSLPDNVAVSSEDQNKGPSLFDDNGKGAQLFIEGSPNIRFHSEYEKANSDFVRGSIQFKPYVIVYDMYGKEVKYYFTRGKFDIYIQVIADHLNGANNMSLSLTPNLPFKPVPLQKNGEINHQFNFDLSENVTTGNLKIALLVKPHKGSLAKTKAKSFEALYTLGRYEEIFSGTIKFQDKGTLTSDKDFSYEDYVSAVSDKSVTRAAGYSRKHNPVAYGELFPRFVQIEPGESAMRRTVSFKIQTQVVDGVDSKVRKLEKFRVYVRRLTHTGKRKVPKYDPKTDTLEGTFEKVDDDVDSSENGIIKWTDQITHEYYIPEKYYFREYVILHLDSKNVQTLAVAINPWDDKWTFGADLNGSDRDEIIKRNNKPKRPARFMIDAFRYQTIRFRYEIDQFMTLNVKKAVVMALDPLVQRDKITEGRSFQPLRDGIYLVKIALVRHYIDPFKSGVKLYRDSQSGEHKIRTVLGQKEGETPKPIQVVGNETEAQAKKRKLREEYAKGTYTTVIKKLLRVQAGRITTPLEFSMRDLRMMSIRSNIMVQIDPVDEDKLFNYNTVDKKIKILEEDYHKYNSLSEINRADFLRSKLTVIDLGNDRTEDLYMTYKVLPEKDKLSYLQKNLSAKDLKEYQSLTEISRNEFLDIQKEDVVNELTQLQNFLLSSKEKLDQQKKYVGQIYNQQEEGLEKRLEEVGDFKPEKIRALRRSVYEKGFNEFQGYMDELRSRYENMEADILAKRLETPPVQFNSVTGEAESLDYLNGSLRNLKIKDPNNLYSSMALAFHPNHEVNRTTISENDASLGQAYIPLSKNSKVYNPQRFPEKVDQYAHSLSPAMLKNTTNSAGQKLIYSPSTYDFIGSMNSFLSQENTGHFINEDDYNDIKLNDYTANPAAPLLDLNHLIYEFKEDAHLALKSRTFVGPCTLVADDNMSEMRPTDTIDEKYCERVDCSEDLLKSLPKADDELLLNTPVTIKPKVDNSEFEKSEYHGSVAPFADLTVDKIIILHKRLERAYVKEMTALSQLGRYAETHNLQYTSLSGKNDMKILKDNCEYDKLGKKCFVPYNEDGRYVEASALTDSFNALSPDSLAAGVRQIFAVSGHNKEKLIEKHLNTQKLDDIEFRYKNTHPSRYEVEGLQESKEHHIEQLVAKSDFVIEYLEKAPKLLAETGYGSHRDGMVTKANPYYDSFKKMEKKINEQKFSIEEKHIIDWINEGAAALELWQLPFVCNMLANSSASHYAKDFQKAKKRRLSDKGRSNLSANLYKHCLISSTYFLNTGLLGTAALQFHRQYKVKDTGKFKHLYGKNMNINVGKGFSVSSFKTQAEESSESLNKVGLVGAAGAVASLIPGIGVLARGAALGASLGAVSSPYSLADSTATALGYSRGEGSDISSQTFLVVQQAEVQIQLLKYEKCMVLGLNDSLYSGLSQKQFGLEQEYIPSLLLNAIKRGNMICEGKDTETPRYVVEKYYYITQHFTAGDILDNGSLLNHVWLLALRGEGDFKRFTELVEARPIGPKGEELGIESATYPLNQLEDAYSKVRPSFPGLYTVYE